MAAVQQQLLLALGSSDPPPGTITRTAVMTAGEGHSIMVSIAAATQRVVSGTVMINGD